MLGLNSSTWKTHHFCSCFIGKASHMAMSDINGMVLCTLYSSSRGIQDTYNSNVVYHVHYCVESNYISLTGLKIASVTVTSRE